MKQGKFIFFCLIIWACVTVMSVHAQDRAVTYATWILESFNGSGDSIYNWKVTGSNFRTITDDGVEYPRSLFVDAYPSQAFRAGRTGDDHPRSLGINGRFNRRGYNWIDVYPVLANDSEEVHVGIPIPGNLKDMDMWVWGSMLRCYIEIYLKDHRGVIHVINMGDINHRGWKNIHVTIPPNIPQGTWVHSEPLLRARAVGIDISDRPQIRLEPAYPSLHFVKFRIWTLPVQIVSDFHVYFKQLRILTDVFEALFDGSDLADPTNIDSIWATNN